MDRYVIYCTEEQTQKAIGLGAPIEIAKCDVTSTSINIVGTLPTAEQMLGWLRTKNIHIVITKDSIDNWSAYGHEIKPIEFTVFNRLTGYNSFEEATLEAIDAALEYLTEKSKMD